MNLEYNDIPYTGGRYYQYIDKETFEFYEKFKDHYTLDDLKVELGRKYTLYRVAKRPNGDEILFMKLSMQLLERNDDMMLFHHEGGAYKTMLLEGYKKHWFFIID